MALKTINDEYLSAIGSAIREKNGTEETYKPSEMAAAIRSIEGGGSGGLEIPVITGNCQNRFANNGWNWIIPYIITTSDITNCESMFSYSSDLEEIPFEINCKTGTSIDLSYMFSNCQKLTSAPKINNCKPSKLYNLFNSCHNITEIPMDYFDTWDCSSITGDSYSMFARCYKLRSMPLTPFEIEPASASSKWAGWKYPEAFDNCYMLDEVVNLPIPDSHVLNARTSNMFADTFNGCYRLKNMTFKLYGDKVRPVKWKNQTIDLSGNVGYGNSDFIMTSTDYAGADATKQIKDAATYQALKDDPDSWAVSVNYSRYNHDSAVATINSLPDTSVYIAENGGTNTIKFTGYAGIATDGGAINTLTDAEIAVATAKGWTITFA